MPMTRRYVPLASAQYSLLIAASMAFTVVFTAVLGVNGTSALARKPDQSSHVAQPAKSALTGIWLDHTKRGAVKITLCNSSAKKAKSKSRKRKLALCGRIFWLKQPNDKRGRPLTDKLNARASRRHRPICGLRILNRVKRISKRVYDNGRIYDPEKGKYFDVELTLKSNNILQVKGYKGIKLLSKTFLWRRMQPHVLKPCAK